MRSTLWNIWVQFGFVLMQVEKGGAERGWAWGDQDTRVVRVTLTRDAGRRWMGREAVRAFWEKTYLGG